MNQKMSVILPVYNESRFISEIFDRVLNFSKKNQDFHFIFVDDGSKDDTKKIIQKKIRDSKYKKIKLISYIPNKGKGHAVKKGVELAYGDHIFFTDADLAYSLDYLKDFSKRLEEHDLTIGWRPPLLENLKNIKPIRKLAGKTFNLFSRFLLELNYRDMQAGIKGFRRAAAKYLFSKNKINGWSFDAEIIFLAQKKGYSISQIPVKVSESNLKINSQVKLFRDSIKMFFSLLKIRFNYLMGKYE